LVKTALGEVRRVLARTLLGLTSEQKAELLEVQRGGGNHTWAVEPYLNAVAAQGWRFAGVFTYMDLARPTKVVLITEKEGV